MQLVRPEESEVDYQALAERGGGGAEETLGGRVPVSCAALYQLSDVRHFL